MRERNAQDCRFRLLLLPAVRCGQTILAWPLQREWAALPYYTLVRGVLPIATVSRTTTCNYDATCRTSTWYGMYVEGLVFQSQVAISTV